MAQPAGFYGDSNSRSGFQDGGRDSSKGAKPGYGSTKSSFVDVRGQKAHKDWVDAKYEQGRSAKAASASAGKARLQPPAAPAMHSAVSKTQMGTVSQGMKGALSRLRTAKRLGSLLRKK